MLFLVDTDLARDTHSFGQELQDLLVDVVDLATEGGKILGSLVRVTDDQEIQDVVEHVGRDLLSGVAPCAVRVAVRLDNQAVETQVHRLLAKGSDQLALASDVAGIAENRQVGHAAAQLDRDVPQRQVAVDLLVVRAETAVDSRQTVDACAIEALESADPQLQVRVDRVLDQNRDINAFQGVGDLLHGEWVNRRAGADPQHIDSSLQGLENMITVRDLGRDVHACFLFYPFQPRQADRANTLEASWFRTGFPNAGTEDLDTSGR